MRPRLGIPLTYQFSVRYLLHTGLLEKLRTRVDPVVLMSWTDGELENELAAAGAEVRQLPPAVFGADHRRIRRELDIVHFRRLASPTTRLKQRRDDAQQPARTRLIRHARRGVHQLRASVPGAENRLLAAERELLQRDTNLADWRTFLDTANLDAILTVTPYHPAEELLLRAADERQMPMCAPIISFDNPTVRGWIPVTFDRYLLWNRHNVDQVRRGYPDATSLQVVGAPQFDFYHDASFCWPEDEWRQRVGLPAGRPVLLFAGGPARLTPHEPRVLAQLDEAITDGTISGMPIILFRRHPMDPVERWAGMISTTRNVVFDDPWPVKGELKHSPARRVDIERLVSTLKHSAVHVNTASTMTVDGAVFDRPQIGPAYDDGPGRRYDRPVRELYLQEHWLPIARSGGMTTATSRPALIAAVRAGFDDPGAQSAGRAAMVREIITFTDGGATGRVAEKAMSFVLDDGVRELEVSDREARRP